MSFELREHRRGKNIRPFLRIIECQQADVRLGHRELDRRRSGHDLAHRGDSGIHDQHTALALARKPICGCRSLDGRRPRPLVTMRPCPRTTPICLPMRNGGTSLPRNGASCSPRATIGGQDYRTALAQLCESYWYPLYAYVRRSVTTCTGARPDAGLLLPFAGKASDRQGRSQSRAFSRFPARPFKNFLSQRKREEHKRQQTRRWKD